jgi:hypothetical protein
MNWSKNRTTVLMNSRRLDPPAMATWSFDPSHLYTNRFLASIVSRLEDRRREAIGRPLGREREQASGHRENRSRPMEREKSRCKLSKLSTFRQRSGGNHDSLPDSRDTRDIPVPPNESAGLENPAYGAVSGPRERLRNIQKTRVRRIEMKSRGRANSYSGDDLCVG